MFQVFISSQSCLLLFIVVVVVGKTTTRVGKKGNLHGVQSLYVSFLAVVYYSSLFLPEVRRTRLLNNLFMNLFMRKHVVVFHCQRCLLVY